MNVKSLSVLLTTVVSLGVSGSVYARNPQGCVPLNPPVLSMIVNYSGHCTHAVFLGDNSTGNCQGNAINVAYPNGRVGFTFSINPRIVVVLTGSKGTRPAGKLFRLEIDRMNVSRNGVMDKSVKSGVKGVCTLDTSNIESAVIKCDVDANGKAVTMEFATSGTPKITKFCPPGRRG